MVSLFDDRLMGATRQKKIEGGQGGKRGHSNMTHWISTEELKVSSRTLRRRIVY
jgi:hypothetical protein